MKPTCLITGAGGFLSRYLREEALRRGHEVVDTGALWLPCDEVRPLVAATRPAVVIHAAGPTSVAGSFQDSAGDFRGSVLATQGLLEAIRLGAPGARVVYLSSAAVYGDPATLPVSEAHVPAPISPYGFHKRMGELLVGEYATLHGVPGASARIFSAYGPGLRRQLVYELFGRVRAGEPLRLDGTGDESRDFIHGSDVARAVWAIVERGSCRGEVYNVASGEETTLRALATAVRELTHRGEVVFSGQVRRGDPARWQADVGSLRALGYAPATSLIEGLKQVRDWCTQGATAP